MSVWFRYLKKRIQPFKRCICNASTVSIDDDKQKSSSSKKHSRKRLVKWAKKKKQSTAAVVLRNDGSNKQAKSSRVVSVSTILFNTPKQTPEKAAAATTTITDHDVDLFNSNSIDYNRAAASSCNYAYDNPCFIFDSISNTNLTPTSTTSSSQSMVTYKSRYAVQDDGLVSASIHQSFLSLGHHAPLSEDDNQMDEPTDDDNMKQQSTPYNNQANTFKKSQTVNNLDWTNRPTDTKPNQVDVMPMPRSNTTYTIKHGKHNSHIIEYFNNLDIKKPVKRKANARKLNDKHAKQLKTDVDVNGGGETLDEIEKLQEVFFNDSTLSVSSCLDDVKKSTNTVASNDDLVTCYESPIASLNTSSAGVRGRYVKNVHNTTSSSPKSYLSSKSFICDEHEPLTARTADIVKLSETHLIDNSMEKVRRSSSLSKISNKAIIHSPLNASHSSMIKGALSESSLNAKSDTVVLGTEITYNVTETMTNHETKEVDASMGSSTISSSEFKRSTEPRLSKNIKQMFRNIINQQMNALNSLEKFYESQANKLEVDRQHSLALNPTNHAKINEHYDIQLKLLEERVHTNLQTLLENKSTAVKTGSQTRLNRDENANLALNQKLSQLLLLKQIKIQNHGVAPRPLANFKSNMIGANALLPNKPCRSQRRSLNDDKPPLNLNLNDDPQFVMVDNEPDERASTFKRNLSLPFKQSRQANAGKLANKPVRSPRPMANLANSTSKVKFNKQQLQATSSPVYNAKCSQFQKNVSLKKVYNSIENLGVKAVCDHEKELTYVKSIENSNMPAFAHIKRQNKSISSVRAPMHQESNASSSQMFYKFNGNGNSNCTSLNEIFYSTNTSMNSLAANSHCAEPQPKPFIYISSRLSDGHLQYKFRIASSSHDNDVKSMIETQV